MVDQTFVWLGIFSIRRNKMIIFAAFDSDIIWRKGVKIWLSVQKL
jgi:hypothetical protein